MASKIVTADTLPPFKPALGDVGFDRQGTGETIRWALNGAEAIASVIHGNIEGENKDFWSDGFMWHLHQGQTALLAFARRQADALEHELWYAHAMLGDHGEEAKARAKAQLKAALPEAQP
jgi:hypothetical protein